MEEQSAPVLEIIRFGDFELSRSERLLRRNGEVVRLQARPFDLLVYLIENRDRVISREELLKNVWNGVRVNEQAQRFAVHSIRRAIRDSGDAQQAIRTVRGNGLQFVGPAEARTRSRGESRSVSSIPLDQPFLGRESFLRSVERALERVTVAQSRVLLAAGEAGIGKTTALFRVASLAMEKGFSIGSARCLGTDDAP